MAAVANATLPMFLDGQPLGVIVLDFKEPHLFTPAERRFLAILSGQCAVALGRADATRTLEARVEAWTRQLEEERAALAAFLAFTETVGSETDLLVLVRQAFTVIQSRFPGSTVGYYELHEELWKGIVVVELSL
jgi:GAF domain-containing protein